METYITSRYFVQISQSDFINFVLDICKHYSIQSMPKQKITKEPPTVNKFNKTFQKFEDFPNEEELTTKFGVLKVNVVYHLYDIITINTKNGKAHIADFETKEGERYIAWMPDSLVKKF